MIAEQIPNFAAAAPEIFLALIGLSLMIYGVYRGDRATRALSWIVVLALIAAMVMQFVLGNTRIVTFSGMFITDGFAVFMKILVLGSAALSLVMSHDYLRHEKAERFEYPLLVLFASLGMLMMISADNLISLYLGLELQSLSLYILAAIRRDTLRSSEAGLKYFVLGALSSGMLLYGASLIYGFAGTTEFEHLAQLLIPAKNGEPALGIVVGLVFVIAGLAFKVSAVPFHMWTPDVYEGAPTPVTAFFSAAPKMAAVALLLRVMAGPFGSLSAQWQQIFVVISAGSMILGALAAINQTNIKRLLAYSSIGHIGYALVGLASGGQAGIGSVIVYMTIYLVMVIGTWACVLCMRQHDRMVERIDDLSGLARTHPMLAFAMAIFMFSMAGIPPLAGFFGKLYVFRAAIISGQYTLAVIGVLSSVVAAYYYLKIVKLMYFDEPKDTLHRPVSRELGWVIAVTGAATFLFFIYPGPILTAATAAAAALFSR